MRISLLSLFHVSASAIYAIIWRTAPHPVYKYLIIAARRAGDSF